MIIWINGAFGSGKTQTAYELKRRVENSHVFDPEEFGYFIGKRMPTDIGLSDFQDYKVWRETTRSVLDFMNRKDRVIIVPMTVVKEDYLKEILEPLEENHDIHHFTLLASRENLHNRLRKRGDKKGGWTFQQVDRCLNALSKDTFKEHIQTDESTITDTVEHMGSVLNLPLQKDNKNALQKKLYRFKVQLQHIRF